MKQCDCMTDEQWLDEVLHQMKTRKPELRGVLREFVAGNVHATACYRPPQKKLTKVTLALDENGVALLNDALSAGARGSTICERRGQVVADGLNALLSVHKVARDIIAKRGAARRR
jgi:hypothetical protein